MRKKIALVLAASLVASGLALWATMGSAGAISSPQTFTVVEKDTEFHYVDNAPTQQASVGDILAISGVLLRGGSKVGTTDITCTRTHGDPARFECIATFTLKNQGEINVQTSFSPSRRTFSAGITGGTGTYRNARGFVEIDQGRGDRSKNTFHLLP
jgi:hypothetical protein